MLNPGWRYPEEASLYYNKQSSSEVAFHLFVNIRRGAKVTVYAKEGSHHTCN